MVFAETFVEYRSVFAGLIKKLGKWLPNEACYQLNGSEQIGLSGVVDAV